jgi:FAD/FMN-containing dehydrogenase
MDSRTRPKAPQILLMILWLLSPIGLAHADAIVNDVTQLNPIHVQEVLTPTSVDEIVAMVKGHAGPISIGGGRYSMGGQTATDGAVQIDMRHLDRVVSFSKERKEVTVEAGITWRKLQEYLDPHDLSVQIMQTYANFTVGGALSVNAHGRYIGQGPLVLSVKSIRLVLADGEVVDASPDTNGELFYGAIGGYGSLGVIVEATLRLADNVHVERQTLVMPLAAYRAYFLKNVRDNPDVIFHNADIYPTAFKTIRVSSYVRTDKPVTVKERLNPGNADFSTDRRVFAIISDWPGGKWIRQHIVDPWVFRGERVEWRNYEASYDVHELEPASRVKSTYVLQEYFVPVDHLETFVPQMAEILNRHHVNAINVSIRHARPDPGTMLAWARSEVFAYVLYYKQGTTEADRREVGVWTRELIDAAIKHGGSYYLPYQILATPEQFHAAYPNADRLFELKYRVDPTNKFRNRLWDAYYAPPTDQGSASGHAVAVQQASLASIEAEVRHVGGYLRDESQTYLTLPEWFLVFSPDEYAHYLQTHEPSGYPYFGAVGQFWRHYADVIHLTRGAYSFNWGYHLMVFVIGTSFSVENLLKGVYERTIGKVAEWSSGDELTPEDRFAAKAAQDYVDFIRLRPWFEFSFFRRLQGLWNDTPVFGPHLLRKWERKLFLSAEYLVKAQYATLITVASNSIYGDTDDTVLALAENVSKPALRAASGVAVMHRYGDYALISLPHEEKFRGSVLGLVANGVRFCEIAGNRTILITVLGATSWRYDLTSGREVLSEPILTAPGQRRIGIAVPVQSLHTVIGELQERHLAIEHIFDY